MKPVAKTRIRCSRLIRAFIFACASLLSFCVSPVAIAQRSPTATAASAASLWGKVLDGSRAPIAGARIAASKVNGSSTAAAISGENGEFVLTLDPGNYTVTVLAEGFAEASKVIDLRQAGSPFTEFVLHVADVRTAITVTETTGYQSESISSGTRTLTPLRDVPQSISVVTRELIRDQAMLSMADVVRYLPGVTAVQGEGNRDQMVIRGNNTTADFYLNGVRDDVEYLRDLYNLDRVETLKGPNAMVFGRGGGGGVINRVTKEAGFTPLREITLHGGSYGVKRFAGDFNQPLGGKVAFRLNGMVEDTGGFRRYAHLERYGINPTLTITPRGQTKVTVGYEHFHDGRVADRGIPSYQGKPADLPISTFFGNPDESRVRADVNLGTVAIEQQRGRLLIRNRTQFGGYDRGYQNFVPGAVNAGKTQVTLTAYNNATRRLNIFNQTEAAYALSTGAVRHVLLAGVELGRQVTDNFRNTGYFNNTATSILVPYDNPVINTPVTFRQSATDADNHLKTTVAAAYVQDQIDLTRHVQVVAGVRFDNFDLRYHNNRNGDNLRRMDKLVSPRAGIVVKPVAPLSIYGSYSVSYLPSSGDQFSSLTTITQQVKPEKFNNYEIGAKWDINRYLLLSTALYRLDRTNTRSTDPNDPSRIVQTGSTRSNGYEIALTGSVTRAWKIAGGYAWQDTYIRSATTAAPAGAHVAQVPHHTFSLWNRYQVISRLGVGIGILHRSGMFAAVDNTVTLPGYTRADAAVFISLTERVGLQANVENVLNRKYYVNADSNNNISPGSPVAGRVSLVARF